MTIIKRADLGRPLTWDELDNNFQQVDNLTAAASAAVSSASASATAAAGSATNAATSATDAANSAANAATAIVSAVKSTVTFTTGGTLNSNLDRISDGTYLYYWTGTYPVTVPAGSTVSGTGGVAVGFWAVDNDQLLRDELSASIGFDRIGHVNSYSELKNIVPTHEGQKVLLLSHQAGWTATTMGPIGGGEFVAVSGTVTDDGGYNCPPTGTTLFYWQRVPNDPGRVNATEFGLYDGATIDTVLTNAINYCISNSVGYLKVPALGSVGYSMVGGLSFVNSTNGLVIEGPGMNTKGTSPVITHTGSNIAITFKRAAQAQSLFNSVILKNFTIVGNALGTAFVRFSDFYGGSIRDSLIRDYTTGSAIDIYNDVGWTEVLLIDNVVVRTSQKGIFFHSNPASVDNQTLSFYGAVINNFGFQHGIGAASYGIYVGNGTRADNLYNVKIDMMGWWEVGGNSTALYVDNVATVDGEATFRYDGFNASAMSSTTQPVRLIRKSGTAGFIKLNCKNYKHQAGIGLTAGVTSLTLRPWLALAESTNDPATAHPTLPGEHIISAVGLKCKLTGNIIQGLDSVIQVRSLPAWHRYRVTLRSNISSTAQQQYIVNIPADNNGGVTTRTDSVSAAVTTTNTTTVIASGGATATSTSTSTTTLSNKAFSPFYLRNAGGLSDNTFDANFRRGFDLVLVGTSGLIVDPLTPISIEIEAID